MAAAPATGGLAKNPFICGLPAPVRVRQRGLRSQASLIGRRQTEACCTAQDESVIPVPWCQPRTPGCGTRQVGARADPTFVSELHSHPDTPISQAFGPIQQAQFVPRQAVHAAPDLSTGRWLQCALAGPVPTVLGKTQRVTGQPGRSQRPCRWHPGAQAVRQEVGAVGEIQQLAPHAQPASARPGCQPSSRTSQSPPRCVIRQV